MAITVPSTSAIIVRTTNEAVRIPSDRIPICNIQHPQKEIILSTCRVVVNVAAPPSPEGSVLEIFLEATTVLKKGQPVYVTSSGQGSLAGILSAVGLANQDAVQWGTFSYVSEGHITKLDWFDVTGSESLIPGQAYYLAPSGKMTTVVPISGLAQQLGTAVSSKTLDVQIETAVMLI